MSRLYRSNGAYGSHETPCTVLCYETPDGTWYAVKGSVNVNLASEMRFNVEEIADYDTCTASKPINTLGQLQRLID